MGRYDEVEAFCLFVGFPKSGHSLVGACLDAHPDAVIAHELHVLRHLDRYADRDALFDALLERSRWFQQRDARWNGRSYRLDGQWQGRVRRLRVVGDKKGGGTTLWLAYRPESLDRLRRLVRVPLRVIHVARDPLDNIAGIAALNGIPREEAAERYLARCETLARWLPRLGPGELEVVRYERFAARPEEELARLLDFLGLDAPPGLLRACAARVLAPVRAGAPLAWSDALRRRVREGVAALPHLADYG